MKSKPIINITIAGILAGFTLFGWGSPSLVAELKEDNQLLKFRVITLEQKIEKQQKTIGQLNDDLYKICQLERKMTPPALRFPEYKELHSLVTEIITRRGYKIKGGP
ncbi:MAG: hypothetical protein ACE5HR_01900 [bacterium]